MSGVIQKLFAKQRSATRDLLDGLEKIRVRNVVARDAIANVEALPVPRDVAEAALDRGIQQMAQRLLLSPHVDRLVRPINGRSSFDLGSIPDNLVGPWLAAVAPDALRAVFTEQLDAFYANRREDLPVAQRPARIAALEREVDDLERVEEALVREMERAGLSVLRRADADPAAVLAHDDALPG